MRKIIIFFLTIVTVFIGTACGNQVEEKIYVEPELTQVRSICELAVMKCYYHNVAKFFEEDAEGFLWWKKDKHFWIEYTGIVEFGINVSSVNIKVTDSIVTITLPKAEVLSCSVDSSSLTEDSYIVDKDSAKISAEDEIYAFDEAQKALEETAANDKVLLAAAQQRAQTLLTDYITNLGNAAGKNYTIEWIYIDENGNVLGITANEPLSETQADTTQETQVDEK